MTWLSSLSIVAVTLAVIFLAILSVRYELGERHVIVRIFSIPVRRVAYTDIESVSIGAPLLCEHWCNRFYPVARAVVLRRKTGIVKDFVVTPNDPDAFVSAVCERMAAVGESVM